MMLVGKRVIKILIVEDEELIRSQIRKYLEKNGEYDFKIFELGNEEDAIKTISDNFFDVIIVDLWMQNKDGGIKVMKAASEKSQQTRIIILTAYATDKKDQNFKGLKYSHYIDKNSSNMHEIYEKIQDAINQN